MISVCDAQFIQNRAAVIPSCLLILSSLCTENCIEIATALVSFAAKLYDRRCGRSSARLRANCSRRWRWLGFLRPPRNSESNRYDRGLQTGWRGNEVSETFVLFLVGYSPVLSAILYLGNVDVQSEVVPAERRSGRGAPEVLSTLSDLLKVNGVPVWLSGGALGPQLKRLWVRFPGEHTY